MARQRGHACDRLAAGTLLCGAARMAGPDWPFGRLPNLPPPRVACPVGSLLQADEDPALFWRFVEGWQASAERLGADPSPEQCWAGIRGGAAAHLSAGMARLLDASLAARQYSPRLEMFRQLAEASRSERGSGSGGGTAGDGAAAPCCWALLGGRAYTTAGPLAAALEAAVAAPPGSHHEVEEGGAGAVYSFDHIYSPPGSAAPPLNITAPATVPVELFAPIGARCAAELHAALAAAAARSEAAAAAAAAAGRPAPPRLAYAWRPVLGGGACGAAGAVHPCTRLGTEGPLVLPGYGVELALKNMEYNAQDDSKQVGGCCCGGCCQLGRVLLAWMLLLGAACWRHVACGMHHAAHVVKVLQIAAQLCAPSCASSGCRGGALAPPQAGSGGEDKAAEEEAGDDEAAAQQGERQGGVPASGGDDGVMQVGRAAAPLLQALLSGSLWWSDPFGVSGSATSPAAEAALAARLMRSACFLNLPSHLTQVKLKALGLQAAQRVLNAAAGGSDGAAALAALQVGSPGCAACCPCPAWRMLVRAASACACLRPCRAPANGALFLSAATNPHPAVGWHHIPVCMAGMLTPSPVSVSLGAGGVPGLPQAGGAAVGPQVRKEPEAGG